MILTFACEIIALLALTASIVISFMDLFKDNDLPDFEDAI